MKNINLNSTFEKEITVTQELLASSVGSGDVCVFATPMMIALMEEVSSKNLNQFLDEGETSVGINICSSHLAATPIDMKVRAISKITAIEGKKVSFEIEAFDEKELIGKASHQRFIVDKEKFIFKANAKNT